MINISEASETIHMITRENLDVRTITLGISLLDCICEDIDRLCVNIYSKITRTAKHLVAVGDEIEKEYGIPIVNKRILSPPLRWWARARADPRMIMSGSRRRWTAAPMRWVSTLSADTVRWYRRA